MYKIIPAHEKHLDQISSYIATMGYFNAIVKNNIFGDIPHEFIRKYIARPALGLTFVLIKENFEDDALGMITLGSKKRILEIPDYMEYLDPKIKNLFKKFVDFELTESYHINALGISKDLRGKGFGVKLMKFAEENAKKEGITNLSTDAWSSQISAIKLYLRMGMVITHAFSIGDAFPFPWLYFEKNIGLINNHDFFETQEYQRINLFSDI